MNNNCKITVINRKNNRNITCDHPGESGTGNWIYPYTTEVNNKFKLNMGYQKIKFYILSV